MVNFAYYQDLKRELPEIIALLKSYSQSASFSPRLVAFLDAAKRNLEDAMHVFEDPNTMKAAIEADKNRPKMRDVLNIPTKNPKI